MKELELDSRGEVLQRWMAHYLAETITKAEQATGAKRAKLEREAVDLILRLWGHRRALPDQVDPLSGLREAAQVLKLMDPANSPFAYARRQPEVLPFSTMFDAMSQAVRGALVLTLVKTVSTEPNPVQVAHLDPVEQELLAALKMWSPAPVDEAHDDMCFGGVASEGKSDDRDEAAAMREVDVRPAIERSSAKDAPVDVARLEARGRDMLKAGLGEFHARLGKLLEQISRVEGSPR